MHGRDSLEEMTETPEAMGAFSTRHDLHVHFLMEKPDFRAVFMPNSRWAAVHCSRLRAAPPAPVCAARTLLASFW